MSKKKLILSQKNRVGKVRYLASRNISFFARFFFPDLVKGVVPVFHTEWYKALLQYNRLAIVAPRQHAKSTMITIIYTLWNILYSKRKYVLILSSNILQSQQFLQSIIFELESNLKLKKWFGDITGGDLIGRRLKEKWTMGSIMTRNGCRIDCKSILGHTRGLVAPQGQRPDLIILDDVSSEKTTYSDLQRQKVDTLFRKTILNLGSLSCQYVVIGTLIHYDDLLSNIAVNHKYKGFHSLIYKAITKGKALWSEVFTLQKLQEIKKNIGSIAFNSEFQNEPLSEGDIIFDLKDRNFYDKLPTSIDYFCGVDPAISLKTSADYSAVVTICRDRNTGTLYVVDVKQLRCGMQDLINLIINRHKVYKYSGIAIEINVYQESLKEMAIRIGNATGNYLPITGIQVNTDILNRALEIQPYIENNTILFNRKHEEFLVQLRQFPKASHDDFISAFILAINLAIKHSGTGVIASASRQVSEREMNGYYCSGNRYGEQSDIFGGPSENEIKHKQMMMESTRKGKSVPFL